MTILLLCALQIQTIHVGMGSNVTFREIRIHTTFTHSHTDLKGFRTKAKEVSEAQDIRHSRAKSRKLSDTLALRINFQPMIIRALW